MVSALRILIVEDYQLQASVCAEFVHALGHVVVGPVASMREALSLVHREAVDMALLDVWLRDGAAFPLANELQCRHIAVVFCSGWNAESCFPEEWRHTPRIEKPYGPSDIDEQIRGLIAGRVPAGTGERQFVPERVGSVFKCG